MKTKWGFQLVDAVMVAAILGLLLSILAQHITFHDVWRKYCFVKSDIIIQLYNWGMWNP